MADTAGRRMSSSADLSSPPPRSPESPTPGDSIVLSSAPAGVTSAPAVKQDAPAKPKRVRKPKLAPDGTEIVPKPRKSRAKKKEPEQNTPTTTPAASTPNTKAPAASKNVAQTSAKTTRQPRINELMAPVAETFQVPQQQNQTPQPKSDPIGIKAEVIPNLIIAAESKTEPDAVSSSPPQYQPQPQQPPKLPQQPVVIPSSSSRGQNYDPIRSSTIVAPRSVPITNPSTPIQVSPIKPPPRASTSPSIASLINPPSASNTFVPSQQTSSLSPAKPFQTQLVQSGSSTPMQVSPISVPVPLIKVPTPTTDTHDLMDVDPKPITESREPSISVDSVQSASVDKVQEKSSIAKPKLPPLPGQSMPASSELGTRAIVIEVPLKGEKYKIINFQQLAIEKYGFDTVFPKLARQKEHLRRVAANAAALERKPGATTSNDEMSIDGSDNEGELSTGSKRKAANEVDEPIKKKRVMKEDLYDKDDPFVDDSEMAWEEQAAAVKDGFFVYSGLLVPPGADAKVEKADGTTVKKRAKPSKAAAKPSTTAKAAKDKPDDKDRKEDDKKEAKATASTSKDGAEAKKPKPAAPRKRPTKAEADAKRAEKERLAKEKSAATTSSSPTKPTNGTAPTTAPSNIAVTDLVSATAASSALSSAVPTANSTPKPTSAVPSMSSPA